MVLDKWSRFWYYSFKKLFIFLILLQKDTNIFSIENTAFCLAIKIIKFSVIFFLALATQ